MLRLSRKAKWWGSTNQTNSSNTFVGLPLNCSSILYALRIHPSNVTFNSIYMLWIEILCDRKHTYSLNEYNLWLIYTTIFPIIIPICWNDIEIDSEKRCHHFRYAFMYAFIFDGLLFVRIYLLLFMYFFQMQIHINTQKTLLTFSCHY